MIAHRMSGNDTARFPSGLAKAFDQRTDPWSDSDDGYDASRSISSVTILNTSGGEQEVKNMRYARSRGNDGERKCCSLAWIGNGPRTY